LDVLSEEVRPHAKTRRRFSWVSAVLGVGGWNSGASHRRSQPDSAGFNRTDETDRKPLLKVETADLR
jgi:hypothetical protein